MSETQIRTGRVIKERRKFLGLTQGQVADIVGIDTSSLSRIERGQQAWTPEVLEGIARALRVAPADLLVAADAAPAPAPVAAQDIHDDEREALEQLRKMPSSARRAVYQLITEMVRTMRHI